MTTESISYGTYNALTTTNLDSLASDSTDPYGAWQSERVSNLSELADDYEVVIQIPMANTAPGNDQAGYVYLVPWVTTDGGSTWKPGGNFGTTTAPTGSEGTASISDPNSMKGPIAIPYKVAQQKLEAFFNVAALCGGIVPDGFSLAIRNCTGAAHSTGTVVAYRAIHYTSA